MTPFSLSLGWNTQIGEFAEFAASVGEILVTDLVIPLASDVALPLMARFVDKLDKNLIQNFVGPFVTKTIEQGAAAVNNLQKSSMDRAKYFEQVSAAWRAADIKRMSDELEALTLQATNAKEVQLAAAAALSQCIEAESEAKRKLQEELQIAEEINRRYEDLQAAGEEINNKFRMIAANEEEKRKVHKRIMEEMGHASLFVASSETMVQDAKNEVEEAGEMLRLAQLRLENAREGYHQAKSQLQKSKKSVAVTEKQLSNGLQELNGVSKAMKPQRSAYEEQKAKEGELTKLYLQHLGTQREIKKEIAQKMKVREGAQRAFLQAETQTNRLQKQVLTKAQQMDEKLDSVSDDLIIYLSTHEYTLRYVCSIHHETKRQVGPLLHRAKVFVDTEALVSAALGNPLAPPAAVVPTSKEETKVEEEEEVVAEAVKSETPTLESLLNP